jgi:uncharacterized protein (TIGR03083 family)
MADWHQVAKARRHFADMIDGLTPEQLDQQSYCEHWSAQGVLCHLTSFAEVTFAGFFRAMRRGRFDFEKVSLGMAAPLLERPVDDVVASLRSRAAKSSALPLFPEALVVSDVLIHTQDVRRPLGLAGELDPGLVRIALDFITSHRMAKTFVERRPLDGVRLVATDSDWTFGSGAEITGTGEALLLAIANRPVLHDLSGDGLAKWS